MTESRSVQRRKALQRGEPMPTFDEKPSPLAVVRKELEWGLRNVVEDAASEPWVTIRLTRAKEIVAALSKPCPRCDASGSLRTPGLDPEGESRSRWCPLCRGTGEIRFEDYVEALRLISKMVYIKPDGIIGFRGYGDGKLGFTVADAIRAWEIIAAWEGVR